MLEVLQPLAMQFELNTRLFRNAIGGMSPEDWVLRPGGGTNHAAFLALHVLDARCFIIGLLGGAASHGFEGLGENAAHLDDIPDFPRVAEILDAWERVSRDFPALLNDAQRETLSREAPHHFPVNDSSVLGAVSFLAQHESYHVGQLSLLRRVAGLDPMSYA